MRSIKRFVWPAVRLLCFGTVFLLLCGLCTTYLSRPTEFGVILDAFYKLEPNSVTTLFVGTSLPYYAYDPDTFDEAMGGGYCYGLTSAGQSVMGSYYVLEEAFKTQSPELVVIDANECVMSIVGDRDAATNTVSDLTIVDALKLSPTKLAYILRDIPSQNWVDAVFPFFRYRGDYDMKLMQVNFESRVNNAGTIYTGRGFKRFTEAHQADAVGEVTPYEWRGMRSERLEQLARVIALCREHGADVAILVPPLSYPALVALTNYQDYLDEMTRFAEAQGVLFMDFSLARESVLARPTSGYYAVDKNGSHLAGASVSEPFTRLAAQALREYRAGTLDKAAYLYATYDELMASVTEVCAVWATYDGVTATATFLSRVPEQLAPEYRYAVKREHAESYPAFSEYGAATAADLSGLAPGAYVLRVEVRAAGSAREYEQYYELSFTKK